MSKHAPSEAVEFLERLRPGGPWVLTAIVPATRVPMTITAHDAADIEAFVHTNNGVKNLYYSVNPTRTEMSKKAAKTDIAAIEYLLSDLDPRNGESPEAAKARYLAALETHEPESTAIIDSGNGLQALWRLEERIELEEPVPVADDNGETALVFPEATAKRIDDVEARVKVLMEALGSAAGTQNIDRILRLPGTTNLPDAGKIKKGRVACPTKLIKFNGATCELEDFPATTAEEKPPPPESKKSSDIPQMIEEAYLRFPDIGSGDDVAYGEYKGRSGLLFSFIMQCLWENVSEDVIAASCLNDAYKGCAIYEHCWENNGYKYVLRQIKKAWEKKGQTSSTAQGPGPGVNPTGSGHQQSHPGGPLLSSKALVAGFVPPDYLIDGVMLRGCIYSFTAPTGTGKTVVALRYAAHVETGRSIAGKDVEKGRVIYFAGENPDDITMRWIKLCEVMGLDPDNMEVYFLKGAKPIFTLEFRRDLDAQLEAIGEVSLVIIDTSAAYFTGDDENNNAQAKNHAQAMRSFCDLKGKPTVLVACHPVKTPDMTNLLPKGGGNFINEVDGNMVAVRDRGSTLVEIDWHGKWRGPEFQPFSFKIIPATSEKIKDSKGRLIWTVYAEPVGAAEKATIEEAGRDRDLELLAAMVKHRDASLRELAEDLGWVTQSGEPNHCLVNRRAQALEKDKKVKKDHNRWSITGKGKKSLTDSGQTPKDGGGEDDRF